MNASIAPAPTLPSTVSAQEAAHFGRMAAEWWDPKGSSAMLHRLNPARLRYIRERIDLQWNVDGAALKPLTGKRALDLGCGGGLLSEPLARLGARVTGIDAASETIAVARAHAEGQGLAIDYRAGSLGALAPDERFDLIVSLEVIEHATDAAAFLSGIVSTLAPGGLVILSTPNRTALSRLAVITLGESIGGIPKGTHDWSKFVTPPELSALVEAAGLRVDDITGLSFDPRRGFVTGANTGIDYLLTASRDI